MADHIQIWKVLLAPHGREGQGMVAEGWRAVEASKDTCPCSLTPKSDALHLDPTVAMDSDQGFVGPLQEKVKNATGHCSAAKA